MNDFVSIIPLHARAFWAEIKLLLRKMKAARSNSSFDTI